MTRISIQSIILGNKECAYLLTAISIKPCELAGLTFIDVSCTRELVTLAQFARPARVILHNPPWSLQRITTLAWPHASIEVASAGD